MSDLPGSGAVGIETVEWSAEQGGNLTLRVTGRWRRRRPAVTGQPTLVVEAEGRRHRFTALPEPPSLAGTAPGVWRLSFTVPGALAPDLGRTWLQFGTVIVPLPIAVPAPGTRPAAEPDAPEPAAPPAAAPAASADPGRAGEPRREQDWGRREQDRLRREQDWPEGEEGWARREQGSGRRREDPVPAMAQLADRVAALERELRDARAGRDELAASLAERDRSRRVAEQRAHAEQALRQDLARQLSVTMRETERARQAMGELAAAEDRIRALEEDLAGTRRRCDEAEQVAAAATAARERAERERERAVSTGAAAGEGEAARLQFERVLRGRRDEGARWIASEPVTAALRPGAGGVLEGSAAAAEMPPAPVREPPPAPQPDPPPQDDPAQPPPVGDPPAPPGPEPVREPPPGQGEPESAMVSLLRRELQARVQAEAGLRARLIDAEGRLAARILLEQRTSAALGELRVELATLRDALEGERALRADAERRAEELERERARWGAVERRAAEAERRAAETDRERARRVEAEQRAADVERERAWRAEAERRAAELERELDDQHVLSRGAYEAISELRETLQRLAEPEPEPEPAPQPEPAPEPEPAPQPEPAPESGPSGIVEPDRLSDALSRLRQTIAPQDGAPEDDAPQDAVVPAPVAGSAAETPPAERPPSLSRVLSRPTLQPAFRRLVRADADAAGRLLLELLPLQRTAYPHPVAYDLVLGGRGCVCVTVPDGRATIGVQSAPRLRDQVDFQVVGEPARIARLLTAGALRRRLGWRVARVRGRRDGLAALTALLGTPLDLRSLHRAGVRLDPATALALVASMIDPAWTARQRFTVAHEEPHAPTTYLIVRDGRRPGVTRNPPQGRVATTIACTGDALLAVLAGEPPAGLEVSGDPAGLARLREWINRAQSE